MINSKTKILLIVSFISVFTFSSSVQASLTEGTLMVDKRNTTLREKTEIIPSFPGGQEAMDKFIKDNIKYPQAVLRSGIQGQVKIRFCVSETGEIEDVDILNGLFPSCDAEAKRVVKSMPKWNPGMKDGVNVPVYFSIPINFRMNKKQKEFLTDVVYIYDKKEISAEDMNHEFEENQFVNEEAILKNSILCEGSSLERDRDKYNGKTVLVISGLKDMEQNLKTELSLPGNENVLMDADILPSFRGGEEEMSYYIRKNIKAPQYPKTSGLRGRVIVRFIVRKTGEVSDVSLARGFEPACNTEAIRVIRSMPKWNPAKKDGKEVDFLINVPISF